MADEKISELTELTSAADDDELVIVDTSATETKRITKVNLDAGAQGDQGDQGAQGAQGSQGAQGDAGAQGNTGAQGFPKLSLGSRGEFSVSNYLTGDIAEFLIYDADVSDADRGNIETYLATKWGL